MAREIAGLTVMVSGAISASAIFPDMSQGRWISGYMVIVGATLLANYIFRRTKK